MIVYIDGPELVGKTTLAEEIADGIALGKFDVKNGRKFDSRRHMLMSVIDGAGSDNYRIVDGGWLTEMYQQHRHGNSPEWSDSFIIEWMFSRPILGRGGRFVLFPEDDYELHRRHLEFGSGSTARDVIDEVTWFKLYGIHWGYTLLQNDGTIFDLLENTVKGRQSLFTNLHSVPAEWYTGPTDPAITIVGDSLSNGGISRPFMDATSAEYFRFLGPRAVLHIGYASIEHFEKLPPNLRSNVMTVGARARNIFPQFESLPDVRVDPSPERLKDFALNFRVSELVAAGGVK